MGVVMNEEKEFPICIRCGRKLKNEKYRKLGMGKTCYIKYISSCFTDNKLFIPKGKEGLLKEYAESYSRIPQ